MFLERAAEIVRSRGMTIGTIDATVILQDVKLGPRKAEIARSLRQVLAPYGELPPDAVSVKAKTNERCDAIGEGRAVAAHVAVLLVDRAGAGPRRDGPGEG